MSYEKVDKFLAHYGVLGMKWGVRKDAGAHLPFATERKIDRLDTKYDRAAGKFSTYSKIISGGVKNSKSDVRKLKKTPKYKGKNIKKDVKLKKQYDEDVAQIILKHVKESSEDFGTNASGTQHYEVKTFKSGGEWLYNARKTEIEHADISDVYIRPTRDSEDFIVDLIEISESLEVTSDANLAHYGVLGMKWGVRKPEGAPPGPASSVVKKQSRKGIKTTGGERNPASEDAVKSALSKQIAKKSGTHSLSNQDLQQLVNRMNLEQNYSRLQDGDPNHNRAGKFIKALLGGKPDKGSKMHNIDSAAASSFKEAMAEKKRAA